MRRTIAGFVCVALWSPAVLAQRGTAPKSSLVERVGDTGFIQLQSPSFAKLDDRQKALAYWLTQASIAIDPIIYDQLSRFGLRQKRLLEGIVAHHPGVSPAVYPKLREFALLFWANRGNHNEITGQKLIPGFTVEDLQQAALKAQAAGAPKGEGGGPIKSAIGRPAAALGRSRGHEGSRRAARVALRSGVRADDD